MKHRQRGFTLAEIIAVAAIITVLSTIMAQNFTRSGVSLYRSGISLRDSIREVQALALSGAQFEGQFRCGFGIHFTATGYLLYAGPDSSAPLPFDCATDDRAYNPDSDTIVRTVTFVRNLLEMTLPAPDIFFQPPDPTTYICSATPCGTPEQNAGLLADITIRRTGGDCATGDCTTVRVTTAGLIHAQN